MNTHTNNKPEAVETVLVLEVLVRVPIVKRNKHTTKVEKMPVEQDPRWTQTDSTFIDWLRNKVGKTIAIGQTETKKAAKSSRSPLDPTEQRHDGPTSLVAYVGVNVAVMPRSKLCGGIDASRWSHCHVAYSKIRSVHAPGFFRGVGLCSLGS